MNATGTRRIRDASRRRSGWTLGEGSRRLCEVNEHTGEGRFWPAAKNFDYFVGMEPEESKQKLEDLMLKALGNPTEIGELDEDLLTISETKFSDKVVMPAQWKPGTAVVWDNSQTVHSTTPVAIYSSGQRRMFQIIQYTYDSWKP